ncbi:putative PIN and TRAM-domain containing protein precursor [bacterium BMS3Bbin06]|nr:putative PIN and TRAM-domain containing protein precursor [bacterium BMS3Bbin06]HDO36014.1 TRAM domain-containing protein [Nitrospirota bacterium]
MVLNLIRLLIFLAFVAGGYLVGGRYGYALWGAASGLVLGVITLLSDTLFQKVRIGRFIGAFFGLLLGLLFSRLIMIPFKPLFVEKQAAVVFILDALLGYGGLLIGAKRGKNLTVSGVMRLFKGQPMEGDIKLLDTSVIIDGRIADVCDTGFIEGTFIISQFILQELQHIADSSDSLKRARGRRGLDILHRIQKMAHITVKIVEEDFPNIKEVDAKLVALAKLMDAKVMTNDFNLNKVAELQGVTVLNINELANALKPIVLPGETLKVFVLKEGKEHRQGIAYLDDGTMVVVENGRRFMGKTINAEVTSVLQTTAGRMIFSKPRENHDNEEARTNR